METEIVQLEMPVGMPLQTVVERPINTAGPGPYFVYMPGMPGTGLVHMTHSFNCIPAGMVWRVSPIDVWAQMSQIPEGMARKERITRHWAGHVTDHQGAITIPGQVTLDTLMSDMFLAKHKLTRIPMFDLNDPMENVFNKFIQPVYIEELTKPKEFRQELETQGMLRIRRRWLEIAAEALTTGRMLEDLRRVIDKNAYLQDIWLRAIESVLLPANDAFEQIANTFLAQKEDAMRQNQKGYYDWYDNVLMWLLGRKPERNALSRTLEEAGKGGGGGLDRAGLKEVLSEVLAAAGNKTADAASIAQVIMRETVACPDCGEDVKLLPSFGGPARPPRLCRFCRYVFTVEDIPDVPPVMLEEETVVENEIAQSQGIPSSDFTAALLANGIKKAE